MPAEPTSTVEQNPYFITHAVDVTSRSGNNMISSEVQVLRSLQGVQCVKCDLEREHLEFTYDLRKIHLADIEKKLAEMGFDLKKDLYHRITNNIVHMIEQNEDDNLEYKPRLFNDIPPVL